MAARPTKILQSPKTSHQNTLSPRRQMCETFLLDATTATTAMREFSAASTTSSLARGVFIFRVVACGSSPLYV